MGKFYVLGLSIGFGAGFATGLSVGRSEGNRMSAPSKANVDKLVNPARLKTNHQAGTEPGV
jgi:hypothetical protein